MLPSATIALAGAVAAGLVMWGDGGGRRRGEVGDGGRGGGRSHGTEV